MKQRNKNKTRHLVTAAVLSALIIVMTVIPYTGYIYYGLIEITTLHIVVIVGAVLLGWKYGAWLGFVWGATCFVRAFTNPLWMPFTNPLVSVVPRILVGMAAGAVNSCLKKRKFRSAISAVVSAFCGTVVNTILVLGALSAFNASFQGNLIETIYVTLISLNGLIELAAAVVLVPAIAAVLQPRELVLGIDFGSSTTKMVLVRNRRCIRSVRVENNVSLEETIEKIGGTAADRIAVTGVGSASIADTYQGLPVKHVDEFTALSKGAVNTTGIGNCLVVSIGTGTSIVRVTPFRSWHVGGCGLGGGTLRALAAELCGTEDMNIFRDMAMNGELSDIDLQVKDVTDKVLPDLQPTSTVASLAKLDSGDSKENTAAGICNMIFENIGVMASLAVKRSLTKTVVLCGTITDWPVAKKSLDEVSMLQHVKFLIPDHAAYITAIGAALVE